MIPDFDMDGVIPPVGGDDGTSPVRSPYPVDILTFCQRFGTTRVRRNILRGLIELRATLQSLGLGGYQWVDGSFLEDVERLQNRPPGDVDVVTFTGLGDARAQQELRSAHPELFAPESKGRFRVDHYFFGIDKELDSKQARRLAYWYSMWSHQRDTQRWKGFVSIEMGDDDVASDWLQMFKSEDEVGT